MTTFLGWQLCHVNLADVFRKLLDILTRFNQREEIKEER